MKTSLESELVVVTSSFAPERLDSLFLLSFGHFAPVVGVSIVALVDISFGTAREQHLQESWILLPAFLRCFAFLISIAFGGTSFESNISGRVDLAHFDGATLMQDRALTQRSVHFLFRFGDRIIVIRFERLSLKFVVCENVHLY